MLFPKFLSISIIVFLCSIAHVFGQNKISEGYIITLQGDTVHGEVKDLGLNGNVKICVFKPNDAREFSEFKPGEIHSFRFNKKYYISKELNFERHTDSLFIEFLVDGIVNLYYFQYNYILYYLIEDEAGVQTLIKVNNNTPTSIEDEVTAKVDRYRKIGTIKTVLKDYPPIYSEVDNVYLENSRSMKNLIVSYHEGVCTDYDCIDYTKIKTQAWIFLGFSFGLKKSALHFGGKDGIFKYVENADLETFWSAYYSMDFSLTIPSLSEKISMQSKLEFSKEKFKYTYSDLYESITSISYNYAAWHVNFNYMIGSGDIRFIPYVGLGFNLYNNQDCTITGIPIGYYDEPIIFTDFMMGYNAGLSIEVPLIKDEKVHLRASMDYRFSMRQSLKVNNVFLYYKYNALGVSLMLLRYF